MPTTPLYKPVIFVTGCASGIGYALARKLHEMPQYRVVVTAREHSLPAMREDFTESDRFWIRSLDVVDRDQRQALIQEITREWGGVDILINNAGISYRAVVEHMSLFDEQKQFDTNYFAPIELIRLVLPHMRDQGRGKIINVSSVSGMLAMPTMGSYSASKYALEGLSEALWYEVRPLGINVSLIQPGFIHSNSFRNVRYSELSSESRTHEQLYSDYYRNIEPFIEKLMRLSWTTPDDVARKIIKVIRTENPPLWIPVTIDAFIFYYLRRFLPRKFLMPLLFALLPRSSEWARRYSHRRQR